MLAKKLSLVRDTIEAQLHYQHVFCGETNGGNRDYILQYRLAGDEVESGLLLYQGEDENFFLLMSQPPKRVQSQQIPPREYIFSSMCPGQCTDFGWIPAKNSCKSC